MRSRALLAFFTALLAAAACVFTVSVASAQSDSDSSEPPVSVGPASTALPPDAGAVSIGNGYAFTGATVTPPDGSPARAMDAYHAAVFVQSWLGPAFFGNPPGGTPPPGTPVYRIDVTGSWGQLAGYLTVYYANDGTTAWISFPAEQSPTPEPNPAPPGPEIWFQGTQQVTDAFNGTAKLVGTAGVVDPPGTGVAAAPASTSSSSTSKWWIAGVVPLVVIAAVAAIYVLRRRRRADVEPEAERDVEARV